MITVVDYGLGNVGSILNSFGRMNIPCKLGSTREDVENAEKLILPGVGSFDKGMKRLRDLDLIDALQDAVLEKRTPIMGICLGMQLFLQESEEGILPGLGWIEGKVVRFRIPRNEPVYKVPHMGWNSVIEERGSPILHGLTSDDRFYFVHSFHADDVDEREVLGRTTYTYPFPSVVQRDNVIGIQCHPERSHGSGMKILRNFAGM